MIKDILKNVGFRNFTLKILILTGLIIGVMTTISFFLLNTHLFRSFLTIPNEFQLFNSISKLRIVNACLFGIVAFFIMTYKKLLQVENFKFKKYQIPIIILSFIILVSHYYLRFLINQHQTYFLKNYIFWGIIKLILTLLFVILLALGIFGLNFLVYFFDLFKKQLIFSLFLIIGFYFFGLAIESLWPWLSTIVSETLYFMFRSFYHNVTYIPYKALPDMSVKGGPTLGINGFSAIIGSSCSGVDSIILFSSLYLLIFIFDYSKIRKRRSIIFFLIGLSGMFLTNIFRVFLLFIVGANISKELAIGLFHNNIGWILFIVYFFFYWMIVSKYIYYDDKKNELPQAKT